MSPNEAGGESPRRRGAPSDPDLPSGSAAPPGLGALRCRPGGAGLATRPRVLFLSDCHIGIDGHPGEREREARVLRFLDTLDPGAHALAIVGDLFDFWFTYRRAIPRAGFHILERLAGLRRRGMPITYVGGNHDYWGLPFMRDELGLETVDGAFTATIQGRRFLVAHGDGLGSGDTGYKLLKPILRHPAAIALYRLIHPDLGIRVATLASRLSRHRSGGGTGLADRIHREVARPLLAGGCDVVVLGHVHEPTLREEGGKAMVILGDWLESNTYLCVEEGRLRLERFSG